MWAACPCPTAYYYMTTYYCARSLPLTYGIRVTTITWLRTTVWAACPCPMAYVSLLLHDYLLLCEKLALALWHMCHYYYMTTYYCVRSLPLPYGIRVTTITWLPTNVWAACPCPTAYASLLLHDYVLLCEKLALALRYTRHYYYMTTYCCVSILPLPYGIRVTTITWLRTAVWAACPCPTAYASLLLHYYVLLCEQLAFALRHTHHYYYMTTYYCVSSLPLPYGIRVTTITWLRTTVWAACPCSTAYASLLLHDYVLLCEKLALALRYTRHYYYMTTYYCVASYPCPMAYASLLLHDYVLLCEQLALTLRHTCHYYYFTTYCSVRSLPLPYGIRVTTITWLRTTVWVACPCPTAYALLLLYDYVLLCEQLALAIRHTRYYYYMTTYYSVSSMPLPYGIHVTTITWLRTTVWAACPCPTAYASLRTTVWEACPCPTAYALLLLHDYVLLCEQLALALRHTRCYYYITTYYCVSSLPLPYGIRVITITLLRTTVWAACPCHMAYASLLLRDTLKLRAG